MAVTMVVGSCQIGEPPPNSLPTSYQAVTYKPWFVDADHAISTLVATYKTMLLTSKTKFVVKSWQPVTRRIM